MSAASAGPGSLFTAPVDAPSSTPYQLLADRARVQPDAAAFTLIGHHTLRYGELLGRVDKCAATLALHGVGAGERVAAMAHNRAEMLEVWLAASRLGAVFVPLNPALRGQILRDMIDLAAPRLLIAEAEWEGRLKEAAPRIEILLLADLAASGLTPWHHAADGGDRPEQPRPTDLSIIMFTSGTTGRSKGVMWSGMTINYLAASTIAAMEFTARDVLHTALPMFHGNSLILTVYAALMAGAHAAVSRRFSASAFDAELKAAGATATSLLGAMGNIVVKQEAPAGALPLEKMLVIPVPADLRAELQSRYGCRIGTLYGLADIGMPLFSGLDFPPDTCGRVLAGSWEVRILGADGTDVPPGAAGEFAARPRDPSATALGYWRMPAETAAQRRDGWLLSGDLMRRDESGWFYFVDRAKDAIRRRGENVSSLEVEAAFIGHPQVLDCAVYPVPSEMAEDEIMLAVIPRPGQSIEPLALIRHAEERLPYFAVPRFVRIMDDFPRTATQKVQKVELRQQGRTADCWDREASGYILRR